MQLSRASEFCQRKGMPVALLWRKQSSQLARLHWLRQCLSGQSASRPLHRISPMSSRSGEGSWKYHYSSVPNSSSTVLQMTDGRYLQVQAPKSGNTQVWNLQLTGDFFLPFCSDEVPGDPHPCDHQLRLWPRHRWKPDHRRVL